MWAGCPWLEVVAGFHIGDQRRPAISVGVETDAHPDRTVARELREWMKLPDPIPPKFASIRAIRGRGLFVLAQW
jgi:hypothetical protein